MPQLQSIVLTDRATPTPVNRTFSPRDGADGVGTTANTSVTPIGAERFSVSCKQSGSKFKSELRLVVPVVQTETINGVSRPVVVRTAYVTLLTSFDVASTEQERKDAIGMLQSSLDPSKVLVNDALIKTEGVY